VKLFLDTETRGPYPGALDKLGLYNYARECKLLLVSYAIDDGPEIVWDCAHDPVFPGELEFAFEDCDEIVAHNAMFDRVVCTAQLVKYLNIGCFDPARWHCTAARARVHGLPGELELLSKIYRLGEDGKQDGKALIQLFCEKGAAPDAHFGEWLRFTDYSRADITALRKLYHLLPSWCWTDQQRRMYALDQRINDRGFTVDLTLAQRMIEVSDKCKQSLDMRVQLLSDGVLNKATQRDAVKKWLDCDFFSNMRAETLRKALRECKAGRLDLTPEQIEMIELRLLTAKSSTAKCQTAINLAGPDKRIRGAITFNGGGRIGRFSHKGFQPGNLPRPSKDFEDKEMVEQTVSAILDQTVSFIWGDASMTACAEVLRGLIVAAPGKKLVVADYSNIEGRVLAWFAGEEWKLQAYRDKDAGVGEDIYKLQVQRAMGIPIEQITSFLRQQGKGMDLSLGYEGGVGAFVNVANSYQLDLVELGRSAPRTMSSDLLLRGENSWKWAVENDDTCDLPKDIYIACAALKHAYRDSNAKIAQLWEDLLVCAKEAVRHAGHTFTCADGKVAMKASAEWLAVQIPGGRKIMFAKPLIQTKAVLKKTLVGTEWKLQPKLDAEGNPVLRTQLTALKSPGWVREGIYGGLLANAITQGLSRDILVDAMLDLDHCKYPIVLHVHDEVVAELDHGDARDHEDMIEVMLRRIGQYPGLPLTAAGFSAKRYRKN
jgi:DNA polymerase